MTASLSPFPVFRALDANGEPLAGGQLFSYQAGTTTPLATYTDETGNSANTNPTILDSTGSAPVWLGQASYKLVLEDANGVVQWTADNILANGSIVYGVQTVTANNTAVLGALSTGIEVNFSNSGNNNSLSLFGFGSGLTPWIGVPIQIFCTGNPFTLYDSSGSTVIGQIGTAGATLMLVAGGSYGTWVINPPSAPTRGALVVNSAATTSIADSTLTALSWDTVIRDTSGISNLTGVGAHPTRLTVPAGVSVIQIGASVYWDSAAGTQRFLNIKKGGGNFAGQPQDVKFMGGQTAFVAQHVWSPEIKVSPGDYFEAYVEQITGGAINIDGGVTGPLWFAMRIVS